MTTAQRDPDRVYWRSLEQLEGTPEFQELVEREFPEGVAEHSGLADPVSRRKFLGVVAASVAMASMASCRKPERAILPYTKRPHGLIPGVPREYASSFQLGGYGVGQLVRSNDGRPTHVKGNPEHPASGGGASHYMQADVLNLYDPARSRHPVDVAAASDGAHGHGDDQQHSHDAAPAAEAHPTFADFHAYWRPIAERLARSAGNGLHFLLEPSSSPALQHVIDKFSGLMPDAKFHYWGGYDRSAELEGSRIAFGRHLDALCHLDRADVVVSFDRDFLGVDPNAVRYSRDFASKRKITSPSDTINRLYVVEANHTVTGSNADHRFRMAASQIPAAMFALAAELGVTLEDALAAHQDQSFDYRGKNWIAAVAKDLRANAGRSCVMVGARQPAAVHAVAHAINRELGNHGETVSFRETPAGIVAGSSLGALAQAMDRNEVDTLVCVGTNPVYTAPADLDFATKYARINHRIHLGLHFDETAAASSWHVNQAHDLEAWGDLYSFDGTAGVVQPLIAPLFGGKSTLEFIAELLQLDDREGYALVREYWQTRRQDDFEGWWRRGVHDGVLEGMAAPAVTAPALQASAIASAVRGANLPAQPSASALELNFFADYKVFDGRYSNNSWMQELPDPMTKLCWDNAAVMSPATAAELGVENGDVVTLTVGGQSEDAPAWTLPGHADHSVSVTLGYGRRLGAECEVARNRGFDANRLRQSGAMHTATALTIRKTGDSVELVSTQNHSTTSGRALYREATTDEFADNPKFAPEMSPLDQVAKVLDPDHTEADIRKNLWEARNRSFDEGPQWAMVIDLNSCTGCNACVVSCVSENNIPMVGKDQVAVGREMFWNRMDRYFISEGEDQNDIAANPQVGHQMVPCMQCENAPCESVCPVNATVHSPDGLNDMVYNRCIGTRYCSNNCPYKVRRFNYLDFTGNQPPTKQMAFNPDVSIRHRGVMEKCTYCTQRISAGKIRAKIEGREIQDGEVQTACQESCPTQAITFGNMLDEQSAVSKARASDLNYAMLSELNVRPRTTYLGKIRNPNPELS